MVERYFDTRHCMNLGPKQHRKHPNQRRMHRLRFDRPGWGAQLERMIESGSATFEEASAHLAKIASTIPPGDQEKRNSKREKTDESADGNIAALNDALSIGKYVGDLKNVPRTGWVRRQVPGRIESVAEHSFRAAILGMFLNDSTLDTHRVVTMALVHDLAESIAGDIAPGQGISDEEKRVMEENAMKTIMGKLSSPQMYAHVEHLWEEYEARATPEGKAVKDLDRFEMVLQADEYETQNPGTDLSEFFNSVRGKLKHPTVVTWFEELERRRNERRAKLLL